MPKRYFFAGTLLFFSLFVNCSGPKKNADLVIVNNKAYSALFPEENKVTQVVEKELKNKFSIVKINAVNFEGLETKFREYFSEKNDSTFFLPSFLSPLVTNWGSDLSQQNFGLITYGIGKEIVLSDLSVFHILIPRELVFERLMQQIRKCSKGRKKALVWLDNHSGISADFYPYWEKNRDITMEDQVTILFYKPNTENEELEELLSSAAGREIREIFLFAGINNRVVNTVDQKLWKNKKVTEILTRYGMANRNVHFYWSLDYEFALRAGLRSQEILPFIHREKGNKVVVNYAIEDENCIRITKSHKVSVIKR